MLFGDGGERGGTGQAGLGWGRRGKCHYSTVFVDYLKKYGAGFGNMEQGFISLS
jgi:hypothetical protein